MNTHEYQAKIILREYGVPVPEFFVVNSLDEMNKILKDKGLTQAVLKIQVHAGGRGKAGGVKIAKSPSEILAYAEAMLGMKIINAQTGKEGIVARQLLITSPLEIRKEYYVGAIIDRNKAQAILIISPDGGVDIEEVAAKSPEKVKTLPIGLQGQLRGYQLLQIAKFMGWKGSIAAQGKEIVKAVAKAFVEKDASLLEINPLIETMDGKLIALDAKLSVDDNALFRQPMLRGFYDPTQLPPNEVQAKEFDLSYVALDGDIGCMVNGAGLAMATMDIIQYYGGSPANFLDVGGSATEEKVAEGFKILLSDPKVKAVLVNIFGGIMNCVTLAGGIIAAAGILQIHVPLIVRMEGTNVEQGKQMLKLSELPITIADSLKDAAQKAVQASRGNR